MVDGEGEKKKGKMCEQARRSEEEGEGEGKRKKKRKKRVLWPEVGYGGPQEFDRQFWLKNNTAKLNIVEIINSSLYQ